MNILFLTPPMTQINTPYPATAYLVGFLKQHDFNVTQRDLALELFLALFNTKSLKQIHKQIENNFSAYNDEELPDSIYHFFSHFSDYLLTIEPTIRFLQGKNPALALRIVNRQFLPEGPQFQHLLEMETYSEDLLQQSFGLLGIQDKAKYLASLYIDDLATIIREGVDPHFEISRYAEKLASSNPVYDDLYSQLQVEDCLTDTLLYNQLDQHIEEIQPDLIGITVPFPGNMLGALKIAQRSKQLKPDIKVMLGGGYVNTELRSLKEPRVFDSVDFICLDDGERPILTILDYLSGQIAKSELKRTFCLDQNQVTYIQNTSLPDFAMKDCGTPSYEGLQLDQYLSLSEMLNPMHRIWSDGRWNKLTVAHGCYWSKCSFCDISLNYIQHYDDLGVELLVDRIEQLLKETGESGFHFVDEAAPPKVIFAMAEKIIERQLVISWWGNIRFEKTFSSEKCQLLAESGCIAITGGLEVASNRLLKLMEKGVTVEQVAQVNKNFSEAGILVHAYLMYGFPSQTEQETIDSLERVRLLMLHGFIHSAFWHRFAATAHSPVGLNPEAYGIQLIKPEHKALFAENEVAFQDSVYTDHDMLGKGLKKALYNYMHGIGFDYPLNFWFDQAVPETSLSEDFILNLD